MLGLKLNHVSKKGPSTSFKISNLLAYSRFRFTNPGNHTLEISVKWTPWSSCLEHHYTNILHLYQHMMKKTSITIFSKTKIKYIAICLPYLSTFIPCTKFAWFWKRHKVHRLYYISYSYIHKLQFYGLPILKYLSPIKTTLNTEGDDYLNHLDIAFFNIQAEIRWPLFSRWHFQIHFLLKTVVFQLIFHLNVSK